MAGILMEVVLACVLYEVLLMRSDLSSLRVLMTPAALIDWPELQCEHVWLTSRVQGQGGHRFPEQLVV